MSKQILLYGGIYSDTAAQFLMDLEANKDNDPIVRVNTPGGDPFSTYGMIAKAGEVGAKYQVDGQANSCGFYLIANAGTENVECLDVSNFVAHRAASWQEDYPDQYPNAKSEVAAVNVNLRAIIETNLPNFEKVTGVKLDKMFSMDGGTKGRMDVRINAEKALKMGLVSKVNKIYKGSPKDKEIQSFAEQYHIAAYSSEPQISANNNNDNMENTATPIKTLPELRAAYPTLVAEAESASAITAKAEGKAEEVDRIGAWNAWRAVDAKAVDAGIESGKCITAKEANEFAVKMHQPAFIEAMKKQNVTVETGAADTGAKTKEEIEADAQMAAANKDLNWK